MYLACHSMLFGALSLEKALQHIAWAGFDGVELAAIPGMAEHVSPAHLPGEVSRLRRAIDTHRLYLAAIDVATHEPARIEAAIPLAAALGAPYLAIAAGGRPNDGRSFDRVVASLRHLAREAEQASVALALAPRIGSAVHGIDTALRVLEAVGSPSLCLCLDPSHLFRAGEEPVEAARRLAPHAVLCHIRDYAPSPAGVSGRPPGPPESQVPGRGATDLLGFLGALGAAGYAGALSLHIAGHIKQGVPDPAYPLSRVASMAGEARGYLHRCLQTSPAAIQVDVSSAPNAELPAAASADPVSSPVMLRVDHGGPTGGRLITTEPIVAGETITSFADVPRIHRATYHSIQIGIDTHIEDLGNFCYLNHSCAPNTIVDAETLTLVAIRYIAPGEELTFFYPSTEWEMTYPFTCRCGADACLGTIGGAKHLAPAVLDRYYVNRHIRRLQGAEGASR
jgi:sugar phosphate isomerase/epimerase